LVAFAIAVRYKLDLVVTHAIARLRLEPQLDASHADGSLAWQEREHGATHLQRQRTGALRVLDRRHKCLETLPRVREILSPVEEAQPGGRQQAGRRRPARLAERRSAFASCVAQLEDQVAHRVDVECVRLDRQLNPPATDRAGVLERQIALVTEIELEQS